METSFRSMTALGMQRDDGEHPRPGPRSLSRGLCDFPVNLRKRSLCDMPHSTDSAGLRRPEILSCASESGQRRENEVGCLPCRTHFRAGVSPLGERWKLRKQDDAFDRNPAARITKMAAREERQPAWKKDRDPGTLDERPGTKKSRREAKKRSARQIGRPGSQKTGRETKIAGRTTKSRAGTEKTSPGCGEFAPGVGFFGKRSTSGGRWAGPSSWRWCIPAG
jgi:hypothetical protein